LTAVFADRFILRPLRGGDIGFTASAVAGSTAVLTIDLASGNAMSDSDAVAASGMDCDSGGDDVSEAGELESEANGS
jgi:hypothetical protein